MPQVKEMMNPMAGMEKVPAYSTWGNSQRPQASTYNLTGPTSGPVSVASSPFTVSLPTPSSSPVDVVITPNDGGGGGTFSVTSRVLNDLQTSATFTYTPNATPATRVISVTNNQGLVNPASISYVTS